MCLHRVRNLPSATRSEQARHRLGSRRTTLSKVEACSNPPNQQAGNRSTIHFSGRRYEEVLRQQNVALSCSGVGDLGVRIYVPGEFGIEGGKARTENTEETRPL